MHLLISSLVAISLILLILSVKPAVIICQKDNSLGWKVLLGLIAAFILGYSLFFIHRLTHSVHHPIENILAIILVAGSIFVVMIINLSLTSILKTQDIAAKERYNAGHDSLTGLANRQLFLQTLDITLAAKQPFSVFILDINGFKQINDMLGHYFADQLLIKVATTIRQQLNQKCFLSRIGGDQFTIISCAVSETQINQLMTKIHTSLKNPFNINNYNINVQIGCGGTLFPTNSEDATSLLKQADLALRSAKQKQVAYVIYGTELANHAKARLEILSRLHEAIAENEFEVHYQPIIKRNADSICHIEALIRWPSRGGPFIPPDKFIPIAEESHLIGKVTVQVLDTICEHLRLLKQSNIQACIHVNLSTCDLQNEQISIYLAELIAQQRILPCELVLEVTETAIMQDITITKSILQKLSEQGFLISLDDFGTGYSSLSMLLKLPIDQIKIDRSFVNLMKQGETSHAIVKSIISLAHNLNCTVVAEGVETKESTELLNQLKCDYLQGYFFSKALPINELINTHKR